MVHYCSQVGCTVLLPRGVSRCAVHARAPWGSVQLPPRIRGRKLQRMRDQLFTMQPLCVHCLGQGKTAVATIRDHIIPLAEGGSDTVENTQPLCQECSDVKTQLEQLKGRSRARL